MNAKLSSLYSEKPEIEGVENVKVELGSTFDLLSDISAKDDYDGDITSKIKLIGKVNTNKIGVYQVTYTVFDSDNQETIKMREITVFNKLNGGSGGA
ncbi:hypothetical protein AT251_22805, partial [Enterovibrio nigricans]